MDIKAIIADDEKELRKYLRSLLLDVWPDLIICGEAENGREALELIERHRPHIAFLDIKMPGISGMEVAGAIAGSCRIVFVTAYDKYAVEAFENEAVDYLLKPVTVKRLKQTVKRLRMEVEAAPAPPSSLTEIMERIIPGLMERETKGFLRWIKAQHGDSIRLIPVDDIYYFKASDKYTQVMTEEGEFLIRKGIRELARKMDPDRFWQIHRGTIVNVSRIAKVSRSVTGRGVLRLRERPETLTISRSYLHLFKQM